MSRHGLFTCPYVCPYKTRHALKLHAFNYNCIDYGLLKILKRNLKNKEDRVRLAENQKMMASVGLVSALCASWVLGWLLYQSSMAPLGTPSLRPQDSSKEFRRNVSMPIPDDQPTNILYFAQVRNCRPSQKDMKELKVKTG